MSQGTISILFGCHSVIHSLLVVLAWKKLYKSWPKFWQVVCIFLHDIGYFGLNYLDNKHEKAIHWVLGARVAFYLFGYKGLNFCAGHSSSSGFPKSKLYLADKYSRHLAPFWWCIWQCIVEPKLKCGKPMFQHIREFKAWVKNNVESDNPVDTHNCLDDLKGKE